MSMNIAIAVNVTGTGAVIATRAVYRGCSIRDTSGVANTVKIFDNSAAASGTVLAVFQLAANASAGEVLPNGLRAAAGLYLQSTGAIEGSVRIG